MISRNFFVRWFERHGRDFPWRREGTSPFAFLVTEMLLRQTRAGAVALLWEGFVTDYPNARTLTVASKSEIKERVAILGFGDQRSSALLEAAGWLLEYHGGEVPENLDELLRIPHIGNYAARAVLCFAFGHRVEIVDINVLRFFARYYGLEVKLDIRRAPEIWAIARDALPRRRAAAKAHNYGLLDFTADICKAGRPRCEICPLSKLCEYGRKELALCAAAG
ncbi:MAG TPA: hypothetical protein VFZ44_01445 [Pyrinomonadaceae bacterium]